MNEGNFTCVNCQLHFSDETHYKEHYKSEHHRYNVKRKLINLPPLSLNDYYIRTSDGI
jgi:pre-60S factor REI1